LGKRPNYLSAFFAEYLHFAQKVTHFSTIYMEKPMYKKKALFQEARFSIQFLKKTILDPKFIFFKKASPPKTPPSGSRQRLRNITRAKQKIKNTE